MKTLCFLLCCCLIPMGSFAQKPQLSFVLKGGIVRPFETIDDPYDGFVEGRHGINLGIGCGIDLALGAKSSFAPEIGYEVSQFHYSYFGRSGYSGANVANLWLGSVRLSPALRFWIYDALFIRVGINGLISAAGLGSYRLEWRSLDGTIDHEDYDGHLGQVRTFGNIGPELAVGYRLKTPRGRAICLRLGSFLGVVPAFVRHPYAPMSPYTSQLNLEISYSLLHRGAR
jgi:hypothetical protein